MGDIGIIFRLKTDLVFYYNYFYNFETRYIEFPNLIRILRNQF